MLARLFQLQNKGVDTQNTRGASALGQQAAGLSVWNLAQKELGVFPVEDFQGINLIPFPFALQTWPLRTSFAQWFDVQDAYR